MPDLFHLRPATAGKRERGDLQRAIAWLARRQRGIVARWQLRDVGLSRHEIDHLIAVGYLIPVHRGVYAVGHDALTREARWLAGILAAGHGAVLSHQSGATLYRMLPPAPGDVHVTAPTNRRDQDGLRIHQAKLARGDRRTVNGIPVTSPERVVLDLAATEPRLLEPVIKEAEYRRLLSLSSLVAAVDRHRRPGCTAVREAIGNAAFGTGHTKKELEARFRRFLRAHGVPAPRFNAHMELDGRRIEVDCLWGEERVIVELDSRAAHATSHAFENDRARDRALVVAGWRVIRITWRQLRDEPEAILMDLRALLIKRAAGAR